MHQVAHLNLTETVTDLSREAIVDLLERYLEQMKSHPLGEVLRASDVPRSLLVEFAGIQYVDSVLWVPMLAIMKDRAQNERLVSALRDNLLCEAGASAQSHIVLCQEFIRSVGVSPIFGDFQAYSAAASHAVTLMNGVSGMDEGQIAGFNLVSEAIVPHLFRLVLGAFSRLPESKVRYLTDHITVDADDHAKDMMEAVESLLAADETGEVAGRILEGMHLSGRTALSVPDALYAKYLRGAYAQ